MSYFINSQAATYQEFTHLACNPNFNIVIKACAGSGKTWLLTSRIIRILIEGGEPQHILAITFTKKAAQEMLERVLDTLCKFSMMHNENLKQELNMRGIDVNNKHIDRAKNLYFYLLSLPYTLNISTFHVWFTQICRLSPATYMSMQQAYLREDSNMLYEESIIAFMQSSIYIYYQDIFDEFVSIWHTNILDNKLIATIADERQVFLHLTTPEYLQKFAQPNTDYIQNIRHKALPSFSLSYKQIKIIEDICNLLKSVDGKKSQDMLISLQQALASNNLKSVIDSLLTSASSPNIRKISKKIDTEFETLAQILLQNYYHLYDDAFQSIACIFIQAHAYFKKDMGVMDFDDLQHNAYQLIQQEDIAQYIFYRLDHRYKHILLDEFQDTDAMQWSIIQNWLKIYGQQQNSEYNTELNEKPKVFIVGDIKQAIYAFRGSDSNIFNQAARYMQEYEYAYVLATYHTRRCDEVIVNWLNQSLCNVNNDKNNDSNDYLPHTTSVRQHNQQQYHQYSSHAALLSKDIDVQAHSQKLIHVIEYLQQQCGVDYKDIQILTASRKHWQLFEQKLQQQGIPCYLEMHGGLLYTPEIYILINLIRFLINPHNNYALFNICTSPIFNIRQDDFLESIDSSSAATSYWTQINLNINLNINININIEYTCEKLHYFLNIKYMYTPLDLMHILYDYLSIEDKLMNYYISRAMQVKANLQEFLNLILNFEGGRYPNLSNLLSFILKHQYTEHIKETPITGQYIEKNAVKFDTIHGAKGLEAEAVIVLDTHSYKTFSTPILHTKNKTAIIAGQAFMHKLCENRRIDFDMQYHVYQQEYKNLLYVAMTRSKKYLYIGGIDKNTSNLDVSTWYETLNVENIKDIKNIENIQKKDIIKITENINTKLNIVNIEHIVQTQKREPMHIGQEIGKMAHVLLERLAQNSTTNDNLNLNSIDDYTWFKVPKHKQFMLDLAIAKVQLILSAKHLRMFFDMNTYKTAQSEVSFYHQHKTYRIDRLVQHLDDTWTIIDYKLGDEQLYLEDYTQQLKNYQHILSLSKHISMDKINMVIINGAGELIRCKN